MLTKTYIYNMKYKYKHSFYRSMAKNQNKGKPRNYALETGVYRFGKSSTYHKKAIYKFTKKTNAKKAAAKSPVFVEKKIGGAKNGGTRMVRVKKLANDYPTQDAPAPGTSVNFFSKVRKMDIDLFKTSRLVINIWEVYAT